MSKQKDYKFHVIQLLDPPYTDPERYVCIPNSWMRLRETSNGLVMVKFPTEELSEIKKRVKKEEFSDNWMVFLADIKYSTNSYLDASDYVKILNKITLQEQNIMRTVENLVMRGGAEGVVDRDNHDPFRRNVPSTSGKKILESQPSSETNEGHTTSTLSRDAEPVNKETTERLDLTDAEVGIGQEKIKVGIVDSIPKPRRYLTRQSLRMSSSANNSIVSLDQTARDNRPDTSNCVKESDTSDKSNKSDNSDKSDKNHNQENKSSVKNRPELTKKLRILVVLRSVLGDDFRAVLKRLHNEYERNYLIIENIHLAFKKNCKIIEELIELTDEVINDLNISDYDATVKELENNMMDVDINENDPDEVTGSEVQNDAQKEKKKQHNSDDRKVENNNPLNKIRGQARKFTLPPEYDPNDSRWTLKHRKKKTGLVELVPHSRVYVDAIKLANCKRMSKDSKTLARALSLEIFSKNALSICSLTGKKANAFDLEGTSVRPGLDEHARTVLLNYVEKYAIEQNWVKLDTIVISNTLRNKIQELRGKYG